MGFELRAGEDVGAGIERIAGEELRAALAALDASTGPVGDDGVHDARRRVKRVRALLRLVRSELGEERRDEEQQRLRAAARELAALRDGRVLLDTLDGLSTGRDAALSAASVAPVREVLEGRYQAARSAVLGDGAGLQMAASGLAAAVESLPWGLEGDADLVSKGLRRAAKRARRAFREAQVEPTGEQLHTWRRRAKDLRHQVEVLVPAWHPVLGGWAEELHRLTDLLGEHHDLHVLTEILAEVPEAIPVPADRQALEDVIGQRMSRAAAAAAPLGSRLHAERPRAFGERVATYVAAWTAEAGGTA